MPYYCTVPRCTSMAGKAKNVSFHQFPRDEELAKLWNKILKRGKPYTKYSKVCSLHFRPEDYTITSVGKNRGQWRTLRKDAIPSQNLPLDIPAPYHRSSRNTGSWSSSHAPQNMLDPQIHQQMAQAIYMQTMLAMQAQAAAPDAMPALCNGTQTPTDLTTHQSVDRDTKSPADSETTSYKCTECSRCFKDPDVFKLHQRIHNKNCEKENLNSNTDTRQETLKSNPILANLLKNQGNIQFDANMSILGIENQIMAALAANMESYIRNLMLGQGKSDPCNQESQDSCDVSDSYGLRDSGDVNDPSDINDPNDNNDPTDTNDPSNVNDPRDIHDAPKIRDSNEVRHPTDICDSFDVQDITDVCDSTDIRDATDILDSNEILDSCNTQESGSRELDESTDSNILVIDENAQKDL